MSEFRKPIKQKQYIPRKEKAVPEPNFTEAESDHAAKVASSLASEDYSVKGDAELSDAEIVKRYRVSMSNSVLPNTPVIPGFHLCWIPISSNNQFDTVDFRKQIGYSVVKEEEVPGFMSPSNRSAQFEGCVSHNELILMKLPLKLYQVYMKDAHHTQPNEQERVIKEAITEMTDNEGQNIARDKAEMTGINRLARKVQEPTFT